MSGRGVRLTPGYILKTIQSDQFQRVYGKLLKLRAKRFIGMTINKKFTGYGYYLGKIERVSDDDRHVVLFQVSYKDGYTEQLPLSSVWKLMYPTPPPKLVVQLLEKVFSEGYPAGTGAAKAKGQTKRPSTPASKRSMPKGEAVTPAPKDPGCSLSEYEVARLQNIQRNKAVMATLGLSSAKAEIQATVRRAHHARRAVVFGRSALRRKRKLERVASTKPRRSSRAKGRPAEYGKETLDTFFDSLAASPYPKKKKRQKRREVKKREAVQLNEEQRKNLSAFKMEEFEEFLRTVPHGRKGVPISQPNARTVIRQVKLMVSGAGVGYHHWPGDVFWRKGKPVTMQEDFDRLKDEAYEMEQTYGRDLGNGWLLNHPLQKLQNFQRYVFARSKETKKGSRDV